MDPTSRASGAESAAPASAPQAPSPRPRHLPRNYSGRTFVPLPLLRAKLGCSALQVWQALLLLRGPDNGVHATRRGLGHLPGFAELPDRVVKKALDRLRAAMLVQDVGWRVLRVPERGRWVEREVFVRRVHGSRGQSTTSPAEEGAFVPREAARVLAMMAGWGGARPGAGRPRRTPAAPPAEAPAPPEAGRNQEGPGAIQEGPNPPPAGDSRGATEGIRYLKREEREEVLPTGEPPACADAREGVSSSEEERGGDALASGRLGPPPSSLAGLPVEALLRVAGRGVVPPFPGQEVVAPAAVPDPPRLRPGLTERAAAVVLARAYRGAVESRYGRRAASRLPPEARMVDGNLPALAAAARLLEAAEVAPAAWAAWSVDVWRDYVAKGTRENPPRLPWVFGAKRLEDPRVLGWFAREGGAAAGGRVIFTPEHRALVLRWQRMRAEVLRTGAITPAELAAVALRWWPPGAFAAAVSRARDAASREERGLRERVERGEFVW